MDSKEECFSCQLPASADGDGSKTLFTDDIDVLDVVDFPCLVDDDTVEFLRSHGRVFFLSRGPPGSGKGTVATRLHELYPGSRLYWADKMFLTPLAPPRTKETLKQSHELCRKKITEYMQQNEPVIINRNTNMTVWETSQYLQIAATYGYTVIILNIDKNLILKPEVLAITNSKGLDQRYMKSRLKQWEQVYPYAMGWSPRPRDAASLLHRYMKLAAELANGDNGIGLKPVRCAQFFPFCVARVCWFGWDERDREYCHSELVKKAYASKDTITVFGYAVVGDLVVAVVQLTEAQAALVGDREQPIHLEAAILRHANALEYDEKLCTFDLHEMSAQNESDQTAVLEEGAACCELPPPSRVSFIVLGSTTAKPIKYSDAMLHTSLLRDHMHSWKDTCAVPRIGVNTAGVSVYSTISNDTCHLIAVKKSVKLDVVFTGHYQAYTTQASARCPNWSTGHNKLGSKAHLASDYLQRTAAMRTVYTEPASSPTDTTQLLDGVDAPCLKHDRTRHFLRTHGRLFILVRGPPGSGKNIVVARLEELYMDSSNLPGSDVSECQNSLTASASHDTTFSKIEAFMKNDIPMLCRHTGIMVWHITKYLALASKYGYTVILVDMPHQSVSDPKVPYEAINSGMGQSNQVMQWEDVHPFAMGWSPRPKDAAWLLRRFQQIRNTLHDEGLALALKDVASSRFYPFCLAKLCLFGHSVADKDYCHSERVRHAYGRSDTIHVFGYAVTQGFVFAMVDLSEDQASLTGSLDSMDKADGDVEAVTRQLSLSLGFQTWEQVSCTVDISKFAPMEGCADKGNLRLGDKIILKDVHPSRITFMPLGLINGTEYSYSKAVVACRELLSSRLRSWTETAVAGVKCAKSVSGIEVYGSAVPTVDACFLVVDRATVELDVVFTGYYQPHTTPLSGRSWSGAQNTGSTRQPYNRRGHYRPFNRCH